MSAATAVQTIDILITGLAGVGKTTFLKTVSQRTAVIGPLGWLTGNVQLDDGLDAQFMEPPASASFDFMWQREMIEQADVHGYIVICDGTDGSHFGEMLAILETIRAFHPDTPCVLAVNKQDNPHAWGSEDIRLGLGIPGDIPVMPCVASDIDHAGAIVVRLLEAIWQ